MTQKRSDGRVARVKMPNRAQMALRASDLESLLPEGHRARLVWDYVVGLDLSGFYASIEVMEGGVGRGAIAPEILLSLWLYATLEGVGAARAIERLCDEHDAYRWICGDVRVNYRTLADFRTEHGQALDDLLTTTVANLLELGLVTLKRVAQDGVRVRAGAGAASFRRKERLEGYLDEARAQVVALKQDEDADPGRVNRTQQAARERARRERQARVAKALERLPDMEAAKRRQGKSPDTARASTTDADATVMKMADGGFRPAYNAQFSTATGSQVIVGVDVSTAGSDMAQLVPMLDQIEARYRQSPEQTLVDGGYPAHEQIEQAATAEVYAPVPVRQDGTDAHRPREDDSCRQAMARTHAHR